MRLLKRSSHLENDLRGKVHLCVFGSPVGSSYNTLQSRIAVMETESEATLGFKGRQEWTAKQNHVMFTACNLSGLFTYDIIRYTAHFVLIYVLCFALLS